MTPTDKDRQEQIERLKGLFFEQDPVRYFYSDTLPEGEVIKHPECNGRFVIPLKEGVVYYCYKYSVYVCGIFDLTEDRMAALESFRDKGG